jgi:hypothetical protein
MPTNMLSMGRTWWTKSKKAAWSIRITAATRCWFFFFHAKHNASRLHYTTSIKDSKLFLNPLFVLDFLNVSTYVYAFNNLRCNLCLSLLLIIWLLGVQPSFYLDHDHRHLVLTTMILFCHDLACGKLTKVAALFYLHDVVYDLTNCSLLNDLKSIKYWLFPV